MNNYTFNIFIENCKKDNESALSGEWAELPVTQEDIEEVMNHIGVNGQDREYSIIQYDCSIDGLTERLRENENLDELNYLACRIDEMNKYDFECFEAIVSTGCYSSNLKQLINLTYSLDCFGYLKDVFGEEDLGEYWMEEVGNIENYSKYFDYEAFGRDILLDEIGYFTNTGYIYEIDNIREVYSGNLENIPEEYRVSQAD